MFDAILTSSRYLLGQDQPILVCYRMTLVAKMEHSLLLIYRTSLFTLDLTTSLSIASSEFSLSSSSCRSSIISYSLCPWGRRGVSVMLASTIAPPNDDIFLFKLTVYFTQNRIVQNGFYQCVSETVDGGAVESSVCQAQTDETAEREAAVHLILNFIVTLSIPCTQKFCLEQHQAIITRAIY